MVVDPSWPITRYGQDLSRAYPQAVQIVGESPALVPSFNKLPFDIGSSGGGGLGGIVQIVNVAGAYSVGDVTGFFVINLVAPGTVTVNLPSAGLFSNGTLAVVDWGGNATIVLHPSPGDAIMGLTTDAQLASAGQGLGTGASVLLKAVAAIGGWINI